MKWTNEEIEIIENNYLLMTDKELQKILPNRSEVSISSKRKKMGLQKPPYTKYTFKDVKKAFENKPDYVLLSTVEEYKDCNSKMRYVCKKHKDKGEQYISLSHLLTNRGCFYCGRENAGKKCQIILDEHEYEKLCQKHNFTYKGVSRVNGQIKIFFICNKHTELGVQQMSKNNMTREIKGCKYCSGKDLPEWYVLEKMKRINPNLLLLEPYKNLTTKIKYVCTKHNYESQSTMQNILNGRGCYYCGIEKLSSNSKLTTDEVQTKINVRNPHVKILKYTGYKTPSEFYCTIHNKKFHKLFGTLLNCDSGCDECYKENLRKRQGLNTFEFQEKLKFIHPELEVLEEY